MSSGDVISLQPGLYREIAPIVLDIDGVHIVAAPCGGSGEEVRIVSHTGGENGLICRASGCEIRGIKFEHSACGPGSRRATPDPNVPSSPADSVGCIRIEHGDLRVIHCSISSWSGFGVKVRPSPAMPCNCPGTRPLITTALGRTCVRTETAQYETCESDKCAYPPHPTPVLHQVTGTSCPHMEACTLAQCREVALLLMENSNATMMNCRLSHNKCAGIVLLEGAAGNLKGNTIAHNEKCGIVCAGRSSASIVCNAVLGGNGGGVWIRERSTVVLSENLIALSLKVSLQVSDESAPTVQSNRISNGCNGGIVVHGHARGRFSRNLISGHNKAGLGVTDSARPHFEHNSFVSNRAGGAIFTGNSNSGWHDNVCQGNLLFGIHVRGNASINVVGGSSALNSGPGIQLQESGHANVEEGRFYGNRRAGIIAVGHSTVKLSNCVLSNELLPCSSADSNEQQPAALPSGLALSWRADAGMQVASGPPDAVHEKDLNNQKIGAQVAADSRIELVRCRVHGHASGNVVVQGRSTCLMSDTCVDSATWAGVVLQGASRTQMSRVCVRDARAAGVLCMDQAVLEAENSEFVDGKGVGVLMAGSSDTRLVRNLIANHSGTGLVVKESANLNMLSNRISGNGMHGISLQGSSFVAASENAVFENEGAGIHSSGVSSAPCGPDTAMDGNGTPELVACANILVSAANAGSLAAVLDGPITGMLQGNILDSWQMTPLWHPDQDTHLENRDTSIFRVGPEHDAVANAPATAGSAHSGAMTADTPTASSPDNPPLAMPEAGGSLSAGTRSASAEGNLTLSRCEAVSLLRDELLPSDSYGPVPEQPVRGVVRMQDGAMALAVAVKDDSWENSRRDQHQ